MKYYQIVDDHHAKFKIKFYGYYLKNIEVENEYPNSLDYSWVIDEEFKAKIECLRFR